MTASRTKKREQQRTGAEEAPVRGPGRPRSEKADQAILGATITLLAEHGVYGLSIEGVAAKAGVGKTTIYRRWQTKEDLILAALALLRPPGPPPDTGSLEGDLTTLSRAQIARTAGTKLPQVVPRVLSESMGDPGFHARVLEDLLNPIRKVIGELVQRAIDRGELATGTDVDQAVDVIHAAVIYRVLMSGGDMSRSPREMTRVSRMLLAAFAP